MLLAEWGKPYQGCIKYFAWTWGDTNEAELLSTDMLGVCHMPTFRYIWLFASDNCVTRRICKIFMTANVQPNSAPYAHP